jgi:hypothetical protein
LAGWYGFRGLVHMAFLFVEQPLLSFVFAFALLPFAAVPALCFLGVVRYAPRYWRAGGASAGRLALMTAGAVVVALIVAVMVDLLHINLLRLMGIALPRLPLDPY